MDFRRDFHPFLFKSDQQVAGSSRGDRKRHQLPTTSTPLAIVKEAFPS
jgi:hypothetical protein